MLAIESHPVIDFPAHRRRIEISEVDATKLDGKLELLLGEAAWTRAEVVRMTGELGGLRDVTSRMDGLASRIAVMESAIAKGSGANAAREYDRTMLLATLAILVSIVSAVLSAFR